MEQKTGNKNKVIIALAVLTIVVLLVGIWAFARYTSTVSGSGTAAVAAWSFKVDGQTETLTEAVNLLKTMDPVNGKVAVNHMAPGTSGSFDVEIDALGSEVAVEYTVELSGFSNLPKNLKFYTDSGKQSEITVNGGKYTISGYIPYDASATEDNNTMKKTATIYWAWPYQTVGENDDATAANDAQDTLDAGNDVTCNITVTGWQSNPNVAQ